QALLERDEPAHARDRDGAARAARAVLAAGPVRRGGRSPRPLLPLLPCGVAVRGDVGRPAQHPRPARARTAPAPRPRRAAPRTAGVAAHRGAMSGARRERLLLALAYAGFVSIGLPDGLLGVAAPSMLGGFGVGPQALGALLASYTGGYLVVSLASGTILARHGV